MLLDDNERYILNECAFADDGIDIDESYRPTIDKLQKRRLVYVDGKIRMTHKGFCYMINLPKSALSKCVVIPKSMSRLYSR